MKQELTVDHLATLHWTEPLSDQTPVTECCGLSDTLCAQGERAQTNPKPPKKLSK